MNRCRPGSCRAGRGPAVLRAAGAGLRSPSTESDLLPVDQAFALTGQRRRARPHRADWKIADGYYLYRHRIRVQRRTARSSRRDAAAAARREAPRRILRRRRNLSQAAAPAALSGDAGDREQVTLKVKYQGCADAGVCYPPQTRTLTVALPAAGDSAGDAGSPRSAAALAGAGARCGPASRARPRRKPLPPEQAFGFEAIVGDGNTLLLRFTPAKGYYLYRDKTSLRVRRRRSASPPGRRAGRRAGSIATSTSATSSCISTRSTCRCRCARAMTDAANVTLVATFQGCQTDGICYPPMTREVRVARCRRWVGDTCRCGSDTSREPFRMATPIATGRQQRVAATPATVSSGDRLAAARCAVRRQPPRRRSCRHQPLADAARFLRRRPAARVHAVRVADDSDPVGPHRGPGHASGHRRALVLSLVYVVANALVFTVAGVVAGLLGANLQAAFQKPWIIVAFAALFVRSRAVIVRPVRTAVAEASVRGWVR